jgi:hypothetical protein
VKIDVGRTGPASAMRCDVYLEGADDPPFVRIHRGGVVVAEVACNAVSDAETMRREVDAARRLEALPGRLLAVLKEMAGDFAGMPGDGSPEQRRAKYAGGFLAALRGEEPKKPMPQTWLKGYKDGQSLVAEANALATVYVNCQGPRPLK